MGGRGASIDKKKMFDWLGTPNDNYGDMPKSLDISTIKDRTLQGIENRIRYLKNEEMYVFDENDNLIKGFKGNDKAVAFSIDVLFMKDATVTHGHPKGLAEFGGTLSFKDMGNMLHSLWKEHRAVSSGKGEWNYILRRTEKARPKDYYKRINKDFEKVRDKMSKVYDESWKSTKGK